MICPTCGVSRVADLMRVDRAKIHGVEVERALVYVCPSCERIAATPQITTGRVFAARENERSGAGATELRISPEAEDLAYAVYAALGLRPSGDVFALPIALGLRCAGMAARPDRAWRILDAYEKGIRARPVLSEEVIRRLDGLKTQWHAPDRSTIARWLVVAGARSVGVI